MADKDAAPRRRRTVAAKPEESQPGMQSGQEAPAHKTEVSTRGTGVLGGQGGEAVVRCVCGWRRSVPYRRDRFQADARAQARVLGGNHTDDPDAAEPLS